MGGNGKRRLFRESEGHALYRMWTAAGQLLYVGIAIDPARRFGKHRTDKTWWPQVASITVEPQPSRRAALNAETMAIRQELPLYNVRKRGLPLAGESTWREVAAQKWPDLEWASGTGPFALIAHCKIRTVTLWLSAEHALRAKKLVDQTGCGGVCFGDHEVVNLVGGAVAYPPDFSDAVHMAESVLCLLEHRREWRGYEVNAPRLPFLAALSSALETIGLDWSDIREERELERSESASRGLRCVELREFLEEGDREEENKRERYKCRAARRRQIAVLSREAS